MLSSRLAARQRRSLLLLLLLLLLLSSSVATLSQRVVAVVLLTEVGIAAQREAASQPPRGIIYLHQPSRLTLSVQKWPGWLPTIWLGRGIGWL